jgi:two-component system, sensor histidine kinase RegB
LSKRHAFLLHQPGPRELALTLSRLRLCAVAAQLLTVVVVSRWLGMTIPEGALCAGIAALALFAALAWWRLRRSWPVREAEVVAHLGVDIGVLGYLLYLTGGATNPFITLYIMPVALAATALSAPYIAAVVVLAASAYGLLMFHYHPLAALHEHDATSQFNLHVLGMGINFAISATLLGFFVWRLALGLRERERATQRERERALRDESILAIATQAAGAAHELNTPLSTMRTLLTELRNDHAADAPLGQDLALLAAQTDHCRDIVRELVAVGAAQLGARSQSIGVEAFAHGCSERFRLLRPEVDLVSRVDENCRGLEWQAASGLQHSLVALLNNAADASASRQSARVEFGVRRIGDAIEFSVCDRGPGLDRDAFDTLRPRFSSHKRDGLGIGLALANATAERLHGELAVETPAEGGTLMRLRLPLVATENSSHAS